MKIHTSLLTIGVLTLALGACSTDTAPPMTEGTTTEVEIPSQAQADAAAAEAITAENAAAKLADLEKEISGDQ